MIKLIIFDLDGVLVDAKSIHYSALNERWVKNIVLHGTNTYQCMTD